MPYIITTQTTTNDPRVKNPPTRTAVATLDEARREVTRTIDHIEAREPWQYSDEARNLSESGGTIPLPDDTVIEVKRVDTIKCPGNEFHGSCGKPAHWRHGTSLGALYADGAYECSDTRCWTMTTLDAVQA